MVEYYLSDTTVEFLRTLMYLKFYALAALKLTS